MTSSNQSSKSENSYSKPFEIYQYASLGGIIKVRFKLENGKPVRLGDGTYGAVYEGLGQNKNLAIKVLYDNERMRPRRLSDIDIVPDIVTSLISESKLNDHLDVNQVLDLIKSHNGPDFTLLETIENKYKKTEKEISPDEWKALAPRVKEMLQQLTRIMNSSAVYRFESESMATKFLQDSNERRGFGREITGLVEVWGRNEKFTALLSEGCPLDNIREYFEGTDQSIKYSNYVLVMDKYDFSLKDLLERPYNSLGISLASNNEHHSAQSGYEILKGLPHDLRAREALIMLKDVTHGLYLLHNVDYGGPFFHLDIKPGNIMIRVNDANKIDTALADLGNLPLLNQPPQVNGGKPIIEESEALQPRLFLGSAEAPAGHDYAPGTHHYRSPEQKYYMDVANVQVAHGTPEEFQEMIADQDKGKIGENETGSLKNNIDESQQVNNEPSAGELNNSSNAQLESNSSESKKSGEKEVCLIVKDPKFENTLIERGDVVIFSKDSQRRPFVIDETSPNKNGSFRIYTLSVAPNPDDLVIAEDDKTQVEFYKKQKYRTDLFGIGAVAFDIMTAGRSPEKFYESIRKFESLSIEEIIKQYETLSRGEVEGENLDLAEIFAPFRDDNNTKRYPEKDIIEFILKCMLYQSKGTFYDEHKEHPKKASSAVKEKVEELLEIYKSNLQPSFIRTDESILIHRSASPNIEKTENVKLLSHEISRLQGLSAWPVTENTNNKSIIAANRLLYGCYYLLRVYDFIRQKVSPSASPLPPYFQQILPSYITSEKEGIGVKLRFDSAPIRQDRQDFLVRELRDNHLDQVIRSPSNPFVPNLFAQTRRKIRLIANSQQGHSDEDTIKFTYRFRDAATFHTNVSSGDWIVKGAGLWEITDPVTNNELTLNKKEFETDKSFEFSPNGYIDCTYFSAFDPLKYYLEMLGVYVYHLIFVYSPLTTTTRDRVDIRALLNAFEISDRSIHIQEPVKLTNKKSQPGNDLEYVYSRYVYLYLRLILHESENSFYRQVKDDTKHHQVSNENENNGSNGFNLKSVTDYAQDLYAEIQRLMNRDEKESFTDYPNPPITDLDNADTKRMIDDLIKDPFDIERAIKRQGLIAYE